MNLRAFTNKASHSTSNRRIGGRPPRAQTRPSLPRRPVNQKKPPQFRERLEARRELRIWLVLRAQRIRRRHPQNAQRQNRFCRHHCRRHRFRHHRLRRHGPHRRHRLRRCYHLRRRYRLRRRTCAAITCAATTCAATTCAATACACAAAAADPLWRATPADKCSWASRCITKLRKDTSSLRSFGGGFRSFGGGFRSLGGACARAGQGV